MPRCPAPIDPIPQPRTYATPRRRPNPVLAVAPIQFLASEYWPTMSSDYEPLLEDSIQIDAPTVEVWALISDVRRMSDWSPQVLSTRLRSGFDTVAVGTQFTNLNQEGDDLQWTTHAEVVRFETERELAFRIEENWVIWAFQLEPVDSGRTRLTQRRETPVGISEASLDLTDRYLGGQTRFTATLRAGMRQTLEKIKAELEIH
jgi:uncharacterized protein YndB with AHSA1/START domain